MITTMQETVNFSLSDCTHVQADLEIDFQHDYTQQIFSCDFSDITSIEQQCYGITKLLNVRLENVIKLGE